MMTPFVEPEPNNNYTINMIDPRPGAVAVDRYCTTGRGSRY